MRYEEPPHDFDEEASKQAWRTLAKKLGRQKVRRKPASPDKAKGVDAVVEPVWVANAFMSGPGFITREDGKYVAAFTAEEECRKHCAVQIFAVKWEIEALRAKAKAHGFAGVLIDPDITEEEPKPQTGDSVKQATCSMEDAESIRVALKHLLAAKRSMAANPMRFHEAFAAINRAEKRLLKAVRDQETGQGEK